MRDLLFKNLTSEDKKRRVIATSEIADKDGLRSVVHRHFVCIIKEVKGSDKEQKPLSYFYILKERDNRGHREKFFCRIKASMYTVYAGRKYLILFMHSLKISLMPAPKVTA